MSQREDEDMVVMGAHSDKSMPVTAGVVDMAA